MNLERFSAESWLAGFFRSLRGLNFKPKEASDLRLITLLNLDYKLFYENLIFEAEKASPQVYRNIKITKIKLRS